MAQLIIGTRGSALALAQSKMVKARLEALAPDLRVDLQIIKTTGDKMTDSPLANLGGKGVFTKEIEEALLDRRVDLAVHSLKDLPTQLPPGLTVGAVLEREDPRDCLVSRFGEQLLELPSGSVVGTSSLRRQAQIRAAKKNIRVQDTRGNLDTRLKKVAEGEFTAVVVAYAGVRRLGRADEVSEVIPLEIMLPAPGQGFIAIEIREGDEATAAWVKRLNHEMSFRSATAERAFLAGLGGGCRVPIAAHARADGNRLVMDGLVISVDGQRLLRVKDQGPLTDPLGLGNLLAARALEKGAANILKETVS